MNTLWRDNTVKKELKNFVPNDLQNFFDEWNDRNLPRHSREQSIKRSVKTLRQLLSGRLFGTKYTLNDWIKSLDNYTKMLSPNYTPINKSWVRRSMAEFIISQNATKHKSLFLECLSRSPSMIASTVTKQTGLAHQIQHQFSRLYDYGDYSEYELNSFQSAANFIETFFQENQQRLNPGFRNLPDKEKARLLIASVFDPNSTKIITPAWLCSKRTCELRFPQYLRNQCILSDEPTGRFNINDPIPANCLRV